ncbi:hypothetical protein GGF46_003953 [Coemansia sp. RSA 552]|nr:hypothetical protein GGF46_003953 [Coemansia sp. RSA 552]
MPTTLQSFLGSVPELRNADRRAFLYSDLQQLHIDNPEAYREAYEFWSRLLLRACRQGLLSTTETAGSSSDSESDGGSEYSLPLASADSESSGSADEAVSVLCIDGRALAARLAHCGDTPMGVDSIVEEMCRRGTLLSVNDYLQTFVGRWMSRLLARIPLAPRLLGQQGVDPHSSVLAARPLVEAAASRILDAHYNGAACALTDGLMSVGEFRRRFARTIGSSGGLMAATDGQLVLRRLGELGKVALGSEGAGDGRLVKFAAGQEQRVEPVASSDSGVFQVLSTRDLIARQIAQLEGRVQELGDLARGAVAKGRRPQALGYLQMRRHITTEVLPGRLRSRNDIERVVLQLQQAASDVQLVDAFRAGTSALRGLNRQAELADPQAAFDEWADEALKASEVHDALQGHGEQMGQVDDAEIEDELNALIGQADADAKAADDLADALGGIKLTEQRPASPQEEETSETSEERVPVAA